MLYLESKNKKTNEVSSISWEQVYQQWLDEKNIPENLKNELENLNTDLEKCEDTLYAPLEFGTAGMRGILDASINWMSIFMARQTTEGFACFMDTQDPETERRGVAITYDSCHMSPGFAMEAAKTLAKHDIPSLVLKSLRPTPELSFTVCYLKAFTGTMTMASHNPAIYNDHKVYGKGDGQMSSAGTDALTEYVRSIENPLKIDVLSDEEVVHSGLINVAGEEVDNAYLKETKIVTISQGLINEMDKESELVYTPLHGTGKMLGEKTLGQAGFEKFVLAPEQAIANPDFTIVKSPDPEERSASEYAIRSGERGGADLLVTIDPDVDRLGVAVRMSNGGCQVLTGN